ncbi:MAG: PilZ domain-containing protein [Deltaproteobacteria bacterium]|nr:PilZ domain-containing protein [Deltaproteobacteria bacterium]
MDACKAMIRPGLSVDCAVRVDEQNNVIDVRKATVYDALEKVMILSQPSPRLLPSYVGKRIGITYIDEKTHLRMGQSGKIDKIIKDYVLAKAHNVEAVFLEGLSELKQYNLRFAYRVRPPEDFEVNLYSHTRELLEIIDVSALGVKFSHSMEQKYEIDQSIKLYLGYEQVFHELKGRVVRKESGIGATLKKFEYVAVQFLDLDTHIEEELRRMIRGIERKISYKRLFD